MDAINNREWALLGWLMIATIYVALSPRMKEVRERLKAVIRTFFALPILITISLMYIYIALLTIGLWKLNLWDLSMLKDTILWSISVGFLSLFKINSDKKDPHFLRNIVLDNIKLIAILEFIIGMYTFNIFVEFILVPILTFIILLVAFAKADEKYHVVENIFNTILGTFGLFLIIFSLYMIVTGFDKFANLSTLYDFSIIPIMTLLYLPFLYFFYLFITYESAFLQLKSKLDQPDILHYAKIMSVFYFRFNIKSLTRWTNEINYRDTRSKESIKNSIRKTFVLIKRERNPPKVPTGEGWSPYAAKDFLVDEGIETGYYHSFGNSEWVASSPMIQLNDGIIPNNIVYYVDGDEVKATKLSVFLNINTHDTKDEAHQKLLSCSKTILKKALSLELSDEMKDALLNGENHNFMFGNFSVNITRNEWSDKGYEVKFIIERSRPE